MAGTKTDDTHNTHNHSLRHEYTERVRVCERAQVHCVYRYKSSHGFAWHIILSLGMKIHWLCETFGIFALIVYQMFWYPLKFMPFLVRLHLFLARSLSHSPSRVCSLQSCCVGLYTICVVKVCAQQPQRALYTYTWPMPTVICHIRIKTMMNLCRPCCPIAVKLHEFGIRASERGCQYTNIEVRPNRLTEIRLSKQTIESSECYLVWFRFSFHLTKGILFISYFSVIEF